MIKFKEQKQTNSYVNNITNEEINLKIHEMLLDFYKGRDMYISDMRESIQKGTYKMIFTYHVLYKNLVTFHESLN